MPIKDAMQQPPGPAPAPADTPEMAPAAKAPGSAPKKADPKQKRLFDMMVANARNFVFAKENVDRLSAAMQQGEPASTIGQTTVNIVEALTKSILGKTGENPSPEATFAASAAVISDMVQLADAIGVVDAENQQERDKLVEQSFATYFKIIQDSQAMEQAGAEQQQSQQAGAPAPAPAGAAGPIGQQMGGM